MNRLSKIIGLTIGQKSLVFAEIATRPAARPAIQKLAEFPYPEGQSLATPAELGAALVPFLRDQGFSTKDVIIGLPAKRLLTRRKEVPPANEAIAASTLRLQAESEFAGEAGTFAIDYAGQTSTSAASAVMLVATAQSCIEQCQALAKAAGLRLRGVTASGAALGRATSSLPGGDGLIVTLASGGAEIVVQHGSASTQLRHLAVPNAGSPESMNALVGEIRRTVATLHQNGTPLTLALWDDAATTAAGSLLEQRLGMPVTSPELRSIAVANGAQPADRGGAYAPAVAVAISALDPAGPPVDFLHSRLIAPAEATNKRPILIASIAGGLLVLAVIAGFVDLQMKQSTLDSINAKHNVRIAEINKAQIASDRLLEARKWMGRKQDFMDCLTDFTDLVPDGPGLWITNFNLGADDKPDDKNPAGDKGAVVGKANDQSQISALLDKLKKSKNFPGAKPDQQTERLINGTSRVASGVEQTFKITFTYKPTPPAKAATPATPAKPAATGPAIAAPATKPAAPPVTPKAPEKP